MKIKLFKTLYYHRVFLMGLILHFVLTNEIYAADIPEGVQLNNQVSQLTITGKVISAADKMGIPGVTIMVKGEENIFTITDFEGDYTIKVPSSKSVLLFNYMGYETVVKKVGQSKQINVTMTQSSSALDEVVIIGYGKQKQASVVAAIASVKGETLETAGGVSSLGAALTGSLPGVITTASTGMPGEEDPRILIRGSSTWNNSSPLILVDGIERDMSSVDIGSVESVTVLKDASATAVYGSRGGNGVILITTKRGKIGKAQIRARVNSTIKYPSKLPGKYDAYDGLLVKNQAIENELGISPESWSDYLPQAIIDKYRNPANLEEAERYPNVDWAETLFKNQVMSYNANLNVNGGTEFVQYFASADFLREGDLFKHYDNGRGYDPGYGYNRLNVRSNLDFKLTPTTKLKVSLAGSHGTKKSPWGQNGGEYTMWDAAYSTAPDVFLPRYADGSWGYFAPNEGKASNSVRNLAISGIQYKTTTKVQTDFTLDQDLDKIVKGLKFSGKIALDNVYVEADRGVNDLYNDIQEKWVDPDSGLITYKKSYDANNRFDFQEGVKWSATGGNVEDWSTQRRLFYQLQLNYNVDIEEHNITAMGLFNRNKFAQGSEIPQPREDWVFRTTYSYADKYLLDYNGAYNGSEKFGPGYRFAFFSSGGLGWVISKEDFMKSVKFVDFLKLRGSYGQIGDDGVNGRFLYRSQFSYGGAARLGMNGEAAAQSPYTWYNESSVGNPNVQWEQVEKTNIGLDYKLFDGFISGKFDYFKDVRSDILLVGDRRAIPPYFGTEAPVANLGKVQNQGYELEIKLNHTFNNGLNLWSNINITHAKNKIIFADDPKLLPEYQKQENKQIGQAYSYVSNGNYNTWDEVYSSTIHNTNDNQKLPGNYFILDYNADGIIDTYDNIPYGFTGNPQNTYNTTAGFIWKGLSGYVQFYGVNNASRQVVLQSLSSQNHVVYDQGSYWSKEDYNGESPIPRWKSTPSSYNNANRFFYDGSYLRLKNAEIAYTFDANSKWVQKMGIQNLKFFINGNNLYLWSKMPDDRESNFAGTGWASQGAYPTVRRVNLGINVTF
ncbi:SusC/RagA family TonB-linked outer membrane protein [Wenyingzhuangia marina]|uniref:TonB-linked outer membrane protein, SusC/RagA family n=1 Tax=Wenyingzhuangia marina TaxID=1195760 RepID=A0A1M5TUR1_9FLAO|nr:TonB-dependent receptor [Wenyingzhuangia marina]SHH54512.1 TonB-linked outer membrane protein, SusC/RagA family [Wenyingzhuangia marina]